MEQSQTEKLTNFHSVSDNFVQSALLLRSHYFKMASAEDFVNMQVNMRHNQSELSDFLSDLKSWESDIKRKDDAIRSIGEEEEQGGKYIPGDQRKGVGDSSSASVLPPVRNPPKKVKKKEKKNPNYDEKVGKVPMIQNGAVENVEKKPKIKVSHLILLFFASFF